MTLVMTPRRPAVDTFIGAVGRGGDLGFPRALQVARKCVRCDGAIQVGPPTHSQRFDGWRGGG